jgi:hypothetical protein
MNKLELTKEHKDKLLEMILKLFPKYRIPKGTKYTQDIIPRWAEDPEYGNEIIEESLVFPIALKTTYNNFHIHWFEFVIIQLCPKLTNCVAMFNDIESEDIEIIIHPIDYLYEKFKLIKHE